MELLVWRIELLIAGHGNQFLWPTLASKIELPCSITIKSKH